MNSINFSFDPAFKTSYTFNTSGYLTSIKDNNNNTVNIGVDANGNVQTVTDTAGRVYNIAYSNGLISTITDPIGRTVQYGYTNGNLTSVTDPMSIKTAQYAYDSSNYLTKIEDAYSNVLQSVVYDHSGDANNGMITSTTDSNNQTTTYAYNNSNNTITITDSSNNQTVETYNSNNQVISVQDSTGTTTTTYDNAIGDVQSTTDSSGNTTNYTYDGNGNVTEEKTVDTNNGNRVTEDDTYQYTYTSGNITRCVETAVSTTYDANGNPTSATTTTTTNYDSFGNMSSQEINNGTSDQTTSYTYYPNGQIKMETEPDGTTTTCTYDADGNILTQNISTSGTTAFTYNGIGWAMSETDPTGNVTSNVYDNDGKIEKSTVGTNVTRYIYDNDGRLVQQVDPSEYDASKDGLNNTPPTNTYSDDTVGYRYTYGSGSNIATETLPNNEVLTYVNGNVSSITNPANGAAVSELDYTYDANGNILTISQNKTQMVDYTYDSSNQLIREDNVWQNETITYAYDADGNILTKTVYPYTTLADLSTVTATHTYTYVYDTTNKDQLDSYDGNAITYDTSGDVLTYNGWNYTWSGSQLSTSRNSSNNISYQYNTAGIRTSKTVNGVTTNYTVDDNNNITEQNDGTNDIKFTYDSNGKLEFMALNGTKYTYETNAQGDVTGLLDSNGNEVVNYTYDTWGNLLNIGGTLASTVGAENPMRYRGYYYDTETGLYYLQSRYYNPDWGRFISQDEAQYHEGMTGAAANLYAYCGNNPVMMSDPTGHIAQIIVQVVIGITASAVVYVAYLIGRYWGDWYKHWSWPDFGYAVLTGAIIGLLGPYASLMNSILYPVAARVATIIGWGVAGGICVYLSRVIYTRRY
jgi:RHS repeat-associated protein